MFIKSWKFATKQIELLHQYFQKFPKKSIGCENSPLKCWLWKGGGAGWGGLIQLFNGKISPNYVFKKFYKINESKTHSYII
jgi:hypothetical protein